MISAPSKPLKLKLAGPGTFYRRSIVVGVTGFKLTISMCSLIR